jgi:hypothetical protein
MFGAPRKDQDDLPAEADLGLLIQETVYAGLDALRAAVPLDLCAYLHAPAGHGPQLFLAAPDLSSIDATEAFNVFTALRDALDAENEEDETILIGGYEALAIRTSGERSKGLHVVGRLESLFGDGERQILSRLSRAMGGIAHRLENAAGQHVPGPSAPVRVAVEMIDGRARAEVAASFGEETRTGIGESTTPARAVATAVIDAVDASLKLVEASEGDVGGERAVLIVMANEYGALGLGAALIGERSDPLHATAVAALDAAARVGDDRR